MRTFVVVCILVGLLFTGCASNPAKEDSKYCALFVSYSVQEGTSQSFYNKFLLGYRCNPSLTEIRSLECKLRESTNIPDDAVVFVWFWNTVSYDINVK